MCLHRQQLEMSHLSQEGIAYLSNTLDRFWEFVISVFMYHRLFTLAKLKRMIEKTRTPTPLLLELDSSHQ